MAAGVDSLGATELQRALSEVFSSEVSATFLFDHPSVEGIISLVAREFNMKVHQECLEPTIDKHQVWLAVTARVLEVVGTEVPTDAPLMAAGVDSLSATELQRALSETFSSEVSATFLFDHPSLEGIASFFSAPDCLSLNVEATRVRALISELPQAKSPSLTIT